MIQFLMDLDRDVLLWIQANLRQDVLNPVVIVLTRLGDLGAVWIVIAAVLFVRKKTRAAGGMVLCSLAAAFIIDNMMLKNLVGRIRPYEVIPGLVRLIEKQNDFSFPSGHAGSSFAAAVILLCCLPRKYGVPAMVLAFLISFSRLYSGVHYPTDVLCGGIIGTLVALIIYTLGTAMLEKNGNDAARIKGMTRL